MQTAVLSVQLFYWAAASYASEFAEVQELVTTLNRSFNDDAPTSPFYIPYMKQWVWFYVHKKHIKCTRNEDVCPQNSI